MNIQKNILKFWRDVEIFNLPDLPDDSGILNTNEALPWTVEHEPLENAKRRYILYFGKQSKPSVVTLIENLSGTSNNQVDWVEKVSGYTCMAVLMLDQDGYIIDESAYLQASYLHGIKCLATNQGMNTINARLEQVQNDFKERYKFGNFSTELGAPSPKKPINWHDLNEEVSVLNSLSSNGLECSQTIYCKCVIISKKIKNSDTAFLNSFYLDDLNNLIENPVSWNKGIKEYLKIDIDEKKRVDLLQDSNAFFNSIAPAKMPIGRWPSNPEHGAYSAQLGAMNNCLNELKDDGIIGVNGPPGTGKTTLLNDIIADVIVQRAKKLIVTNGLNLFAQGEKIEKESGFFYHFPIATTLFDDAGIIVASNNNAAVENISKELPAKEKLNNSFKNANYFSDFTQQLIDGESWGLLAAALGNSENRKKFKENFWFNGEERQGFGSFLQKLYNNPENEDKTIAYRGLFDTAKKELTTLLKEFEIFRKKATDFHGLLYRNLQDHKSKTHLQNQLKKLTKEAEILNNSINEEQEKKQQINGEVVSVKELIKIYQDAKPSFFFLKKLFNTKSFKEWNGPFLTSIAELNRLSGLIIDSNKKLLELQIQIDKNRSADLKLTQELKLILDRIRQYQTLKDNMHHEYGIAYGNIPDEHLLSAFSLDKDVFHKSNPWSSIKINTLRSNIFLKSLEIHKYVVLINAKQFKNNISILLEIMDGKAIVSKNIATSVWKTFFFFIPVVSTSLASVSRLFKFLDEDAIGWLLIDEAGQATPQSVAGIIKRAKRSIVIGDPLQIEPVLTTPHRLLQILNEPYKTDSVWSPLQTSAQQLADRITNEGTIMDLGNDNEIWTGFPLRTHRRCNNPMFDLANKIAYSSQMVKALPDGDFECNLGASTWYHVAGKTVINTHVIIEEIVTLEEKLNALGKEPEIFVISPFKSVANKCKEDLLNRYPNVKCGTIHTFQGKEADIVFLILGSDPAKSGARNWASQKPNMLNVALTRAKKRFYIIGNKNLWQSCKYFDVISNAL